MIFTQNNRFKPELAYHVLSFDVNVHRFVAVETVKEEAVWPGNILNDRHCTDYRLLFLHNKMACYRRLISCSIPRQDFYPITPRG